MRTVITAILLVLVVSTLPAPSQATVGKSIACSAIDIVLGCVSASASASHVCTTSGNCFYRLSGGATACSATGGEVSMMSQQLGYKEDVIPAGGCKSVSNSRVDTIQCVEVTGTYSGLTTDSDVAADCAPPLGDDAEKKVRALIEINP